MSADGLSSPAGGRDRVAPDTDACVAWLRRAIRLPGLRADAWSEDNEAVATAFVATSEASKLIAYVAADGELVLLAPNAALSVAPKAFQYFIKRAAAAAAPRDGAGARALTAAPTTLKELRASLQMGFVNGSGVDSLLRLMGDALMPAMRAEGGGPMAAWPESVRKDFVGQSQRCVRAPSARARPPPPVARRQTDRAPVPPSPLGPQLHGLPF